MLDKSERPAATLAREPWKPMSDDWMPCSRSRDSVVALDRVLCTGKLVVQPAADMQIEATASSVVTRLM
jgi:hypothetical protein